MIAKLYTILFGLIGGYGISILIYSIPNEIRLLAFKTSDDKLITKRFLIVATLALIVSISMYSKYQDDFIHYFISSLCFYTIIALAFIDIDYKAVPDSLNISAYILALFSTSDIVVSMIDSFVLMGGFFALRFIVSYILDKEAMGEADILIAGCIGAFAGVKLGVIAIVVATIIALPFSLYLRRHHEHELPFVPFLGIGLYLVILFDKLFLDIFYFLYKI